MDRVDERRNGERSCRVGEIYFRRPRENPYMADIRNLSAGGCCFEAPVQVSVGDRVWLRMAGLESIASTVAWSEEWTAGARFDRPLHPAVFAAVSARLASAI